MSVPVGNLNNFKGVSLDNILGVNKTANLRVKIEKTTKNRREYSTSYINFPMIDRIIQHFCKNNLCEKYGAKKPPKGAESILHGRGIVSYSMMEKGSGKAKKADFGILK
jgi:hypothetical protein